MATIDPGRSLVKQLEAGASILAAARTAETRLVKARLVAFERAQNKYKEAHGEVGIAEARLLAAETALAELDLDQDHVVDAVARALIAEGLSRGNPFTTFGPLAPAALTALPTAEEAKAIHQLVGAIQREQKYGKATLQAVQRLDQAARAVERGLAQIEKVTATVREARHKRDAAGQTWATALAALKRGARAAADDGAPTLYATLFERPTKPNGKAAKPAPTPPVPPPSPDPAGQPAVTAAS